jgi:hypothetical protein
MFYSTFYDQELKVIPTLGLLYFELISMENPNSDCNDLYVFVLLIITKKFVFYPYPSSYYSVPEQSARRRIDVVTLMFKYL